MPHIRIARFTPPTLPQSIEQTHFIQAYQNRHKNPDWLILTQIEQYRFFIWVKPSEEGYLLKAEKATRPTTNYYLQKALKDFATLLGVKPDQSNIPDVIKKQHLEKQDKTLKEISFFTQNFPHDKPLVIEIGFGSGRHLLYQAKQNPQYLYIGLEIHKPSIEQVIKQIKLQSIENILLLNYDARIFLEFVPSNSVKQIFVHFPVPWDKKPSRRVISKNFIKESTRVLQPQGTLELRTDSENYFHYALETFLNSNRLDIHIKKNQDAAITSKYEDRWRKQEKNIYDIIMQGLEESKPLEQKGRFDFPNQEPAHQTLKEYIGKTLKKAEGFLHFERLYEQSNKDYFVRLSLGNFEHPEHLYLHVCEDQVSYFPHEPIPSSSNLMMHHTLKEVLYG